MSQSTGRERRAYPRASLDVDASVGLKGFDLLPVTAVNVSASGIYIVCDRSLGEMTRVELVLRFPGMRDIGARAVVIREERLGEGRFGLGLFFTSIRDEDRALIAEIIAGTAAGGALSQ
ncbi:hypothetical protein GX411_11500 [Candidatus Fermentibacteria bacterium]|nr:hypothetical protein [Candidatus Fermentibacteria bacterium]